MRHLGSWLVSDMRRARQWSDDARHRRDRAFPRVRARPGADVTAHEPPVVLGDGLDAGVIAGLFARLGRIHVAGILATSCAARAYDCLATEIPWSLHFNSGQDARDIPLQVLEQMSEPDRKLICDSIYRQATHGFQYLYDNFSLSDAHAAGQHLELYVMRILAFLNSPTFLEWARQVTGVKAIALADAQATRYRAGHFLTSHDDAVEGKNRVAAYVLNFTPVWGPDWGGILNFIDRDGHIAEGYTPAFNAINILRVPQAHSVSIVAPFAGGARYSITGWLRTA